MDVAALVKFTVIESEVHFARRVKHHHLVLSRYEHIHILIMGVSSTIVSYSFSHTYIVISNPGLFPYPSELTSMSEIYSHAYHVFLLQRLLYLYESV